MSIEIAVFGAGCFWCVEAAFEKLKGVEKVLPGYAGGELENPSYKQVKTGTTGHVEVVQIHFNPEIISYPELLDVFFSLHDPTSLNKQGADEGTQYASAIFAVNAEQKEMAQHAIQEAQPHYDQPIVTALYDNVPFWEAEDYHHHYFENNPDQPYCSLVVAEKVNKFMKKFAHKLK